MRQVFRRARRAAPGRPLWYVQRADRRGGISPSGSSNDKADDARYIGSIESVKERAVEEEASQRPSRAVTAAGTRLEIGRAEDIAAKLEALDPAADGG